MTFLADFFDTRTKTRVQLAPYDFGILQNGKELDKVHGLTEIGTGIHKYVFSRAGPITIRIENVGDNKDAISEFNTIVYPNQDISSSSSSSAGGGANSTTTGDGANDITRVSGGTQPVSRILNPLTLV
jgi:hypothetical protein